MPRPELLDPQSKVVLLGLEAETEEIAREKVEKACSKLLANLIMESYTFELKQV
jgi:phosphoribosylformylglycinamidine synthase subunit PurS